MNHTTNDWVWELDKSNIHTYASPSVEDILGYCPADIVGKMPFDFMIEDDARRLRLEFADIAEKSQTFSGMENTNVHKNGSLVILETNGVPVFDHNRVTVGYRGIDRDISERKQAERTRIELAEKRKNELIREVHHRIKNHLQGLMGLLKLRKKDSHNFNAIIDEAIIQIESIAIVYGLQASEPGAQIYMGQMVDAIIHSAAGLTHLLLSVTHGKKSGSCEVNRNKAVALALIINELVTNAIKHFSSTDNCSEIKIHHEYEPEQLILSVQNPGQLPSGFDLHAENFLGTGLFLAKAMLPTRGAELMLEEKSNMVVATLIVGIRLFWRIVVKRRCELRKVSS